MFQKSEPPFFVLKRYAQSLDIDIKMDSENLAENLQVLAIKHFQKYAFHSLYFNLKDKRNSENQDIPLLMNKNALIHQLMQDGGGSCYHHNAVFQMILEANGIKSWFISCLVNNPMKPEETFKMATHVAIVFNYKESSWLFDPGWNGTSFSIYPLPSISGDITRKNNYQLRKTDHTDFPYTFEEIRYDSIVPRYAFSSQQTELEDFSEAIRYLNSRDYAFHTLFIFTRINAEQQIIRFVNRLLVIQNLNGEMLLNETIGDEISIIQKLTDLFSAQDSLMEMICATDFKNPELGNLVCQTPASTLVHCQK